LKTYSHYKTPQIADESVLLRKTQDGSTFGEDKSKNYRRGVYNKVCK